MSNAGQAILGGVGAVTGGILTLGNPKGIILGAQIGLMLGSVLFPTKAESPDPTISDIQVTTSQYGSPLPVVLGTRIVSGNLIYYGNFQTIIEEEEEGGKGGGGTTVTTVRYTVTLAIGVCLATKPTSILNVWANSELISTDKYIAYDGTQTSPDSTLSTVMAAEGKTRIPVWKNFCYIVLPDFDLGSNPNVPNFKIEVKSSKYNYEETIAGNYIGSTYIGGSAATCYIGNNQLVGVYSAFLGGGLYDTVFNIHDATTGEVLSSVSSDDIAGLSGATESYTWCGGEESHLVNNIDVYATGSFELIRHINIYTDYVFSLPLRRGAALGDCLYAVVKQFNYGAEKPYSVYLICIDVSGSISPLLLLGSYASSSDAECINFTYAAIWAGTMTYNSITKNRILLQPLNSSSISMYDTSGTLEATLEGAPVSTTPNHLVYSEGAGVYCCKAVHPYSNEVYFYPNANTMILAASAVVPSAEGQGHFYSPANSGKIHYFCYASNKFYYALFTYETGGIIQGDDYDALDLCPTTVSREVLTNTLWGLGLDEDTCLHDADFLATETYTYANDLLVSMVFNSQSSVLDILQKIINHHNGFITYANGRISHRQLKTETPAASLTCPGDIVIKDNELPVSITKSGARDSYNKAVVEYTKRYDSASNEYYVTRTASDSDMVDIATNGLKPETISLDGLTTYTRAAKMAGIMLLKSLLNPVSITFLLGPKSLGIKPGDVYELTYSNLELNAFDIRISSISEKDDYTIEVEAQEENTGIYDLTYYGSDSTVTPLPPAIFADATDVINPIAIEIPAMYAYDKELIAVTYSKADEIQWAGASVHRAYASGGPYTRLDTSYKSGVTGTVTAVTMTDDEATITVELDWDFTLSSATSLDALMATPRQNLCAFTGSYGTVFCRFSDATLVSGNAWELSGLIHDTTGFPELNTYGEIEADDVFVYYNNLPFLQDLPVSDMDRTLYYKIASFNFKGIAQSLADVTAISIAPEGLVSKPLPPCNVIVNYTGINDTDTIKVGAGDLEISWMSRNRRNEGGLNYDYADAVNDDFDFVEYILEIYNGTTLMRTVEQTAKTYDYTTALQTSDGAIPPFTCKLYQRGLSDVSEPYIFTIDTPVVIATGGTITYDGDYKIHTFTSSGTFNVAHGNDVEYLVVAGGGGGGGQLGGGGGGGGVLTGTLAVTAGSKTVTIGNGGNGGVSANSAGTNGGDSVFDSITATGGGGGGAYNAGAPGNGGSGGGGKGAGYTEFGTGIPGQGHDGAPSIAAVGGGGGGGAGEAGDNGDPTPYAYAGYGGDGVASTISGAAVYYGGGGGGGNSYGTGSATGGNGGGGNGAWNRSNNATAGTASTGGGGGGGSEGSAGTAVGKAGGSGIVIIRYLYQ